MILAAGRGERLKPLTTITPKPLLKIGNTTLIGHVLRQIQAAGITEVVINVHHLGDQIIQYCGNGSAFGLTIQYSIEEELLETGGGIFRALPLLGDQPFLLMSADVWTNYPLEKIIHKKVSHAHLMFVDNPDFHVSGDYGLDEKGFVRDDLADKLTYASFGILHPSLFAAEKEGIFRLTRVLKPAIEKHLVTGERYSGEWYNVGTQKELLALQAIAFSKTEP